MTKDEELANKYRRKDYTSEPILTKEKPSGPPRKTTARKSKYSYIYRGTFLFLLILATVSIVGIWLFLVKDSSNLLQEDLKELQGKTTFPIYIPSHMPEGFTYNDNSADLAQGTILYYISSKKNEKIFFSVQAKPKNVVFDDFYTRVLSNKSDVISRHGKAVVGNNGSQIMGSLVTDKTWILINTPSKTSQDSVSRLVESLEPVK